MTYLLMKEELRIILNQIIFDIISNNIFPQLSVPYFASYRRLALNI